VARDFAGKNRNAAARKKPAARRKAPGSSPWPWYFAGLFSGVFACGLVWLAMQQPDTAAAIGGAAVEDDGKPAGDGLRFDFYTLLPQQKIDVELDEATIAAERGKSGYDQFVLQAGSFKQGQDADRRRAELLLLGLDAHVEETTGDNGRWYRVYIGPFESRSRLQKARGTTAQQGIDTLLLKRPEPGQG